MENGLGSEKTRGVDSSEVAGAEVTMGSTEEKRWTQQTFRRIISVTGWQATETNSGEQLKHTGGIRSTAGESPGGGHT